MERRLWRYCRRHFRRGLGREHGEPHWRRVAAFGEMLCDGDPSVDRQVVRAFACLHDVERVDNLSDPGHGPRAAGLVRRIRRRRLSYLSEEQVGLLQAACAEHTSSLRTENETVNACLDADRLDLVRGGVLPSPGRMASQVGASLAGRRDFVDGVWLPVNRATHRPPRPLLYSLFLH